MTSTRPIDGPDDPVLSGILEPDRLVDRESEPVFVLGTPRSGTRALTLALQEGAGLGGFAHGDFLPLHRRMLDEIEWHYSTLAADYLSDREGNLIANTSRDHVEARLANWFAATYAREIPRGRWVDHDPETVRGAPSIREAPEILKIFPRARFIFVARRAIESILSCHARSPGTPIQHFAWIWQDTIDAWGKTRPALEGRSLEIHQHEMALDATGVASRVAEFLGLDAAARDGLAKLLEKNRPGQDHFAREFRRIGLDETPWKPNQRRLVQDICGTMMDGAGYDFAASTVGDSRPMSLFLPESPKVWEARNVPSPEHLRKEESGALAFRPGAPGAPPAEFRWLAAFLEGVNRFSAQLSVPETSPCSVVCRIRIESHGSREVLRRMQRVVAPGEEIDWVEDFDVLGPGDHDVIMAVMAAQHAESSDGAVALWKNGAFHFAAGSPDGRS